MNATTAIMKLNARLSASAVEDSLSEREPSSFLILWKNDRLVAL
jgi:hypothetical protein